MKEIKTVNNVEQLIHCSEVIQSLRPHLTTERILEYYSTMKYQKFQIIYLEEDGKPVAYAGFRYITHFFSGNIIYVDDLGTLQEYRRKGNAGILLDHIIGLAKEKDLYGVQLDSAHYRYEAHRFYLNRGFKINSYHFNLLLKEVK